MGHAHLVRGAALGPLLTHPQELRWTQMQQPWRHLSPQQRLWVRPLNPASWQGRLGDHLVPLEEQAKETEERSGLPAELP